MWSSWKRAWDPKPANVVTLRLHCASPPSNIDMLVEVGASMVLRKRLTVASFSISSSVAPRDASPMSWKDKGRGRPQDRFAAIGWCYWEFLFHSLLCSWCQGICSHFPVFLLEPFVWNAAFSHSFVASSFSCPEHCPATPLHLQASTPTHCSWDSLPLPPANHCLPSFPQTHLFLDGYEKGMSETLTGCLVFIALRQQISVPWTAMHLLWAHVQVKCVQLLVQQKLRWSPERSSSPPGNIFGPLCQKHDTEVSLVSYLALGVLRVKKQMATLPERTGQMSCRPASGRAPAARDSSPCHCQGEGGKHGQQQIG